ncbi:MAG: transposase [Candidatus Omnitrophota bacterium]
MEYRKHNRLPEYDYSQDGYYFVTICTHNRKEYLGRIENGNMILNEYGRIVEKQWIWLSEQYNYIQLDKFIVMPNHLHGILVIVGNGRDRSLQKIKSLSELIGAFKTTSSKSIHMAGLVDFHWQKSFFDHVIRNENELMRIQEYIVNNPKQWELDVENVGAGLKPAPTVIPCK